MLSAPLSGSGETIGHITSNERSHTNLFLFMQQPIINKTRKSKVQQKKKIPRGITRATNLYCERAGKRLNSYFECWTVGLILHNNIRKAMAVACPIAWLRLFSWAYWRAAIGGAARVYHSICWERRHRTIVDCRHCRTNGGRAAAYRFETRDFYR